MTRKQRRASLLLGLLVLLAIAGGLVLYALRETITYFKTPSDITAASFPPEQRFRLGGLVAKGSVKRGQGAEVEFGVTDTLKTITVVYKGVLPDLFREGQGVVAEGRLEKEGRFRADSVLAKHDETYMPPEVAKALQEKGVKLGSGATHPGDAPPATPVKSGK
ncbi:MAG: cytochrome c maturation protein CcmE [Hyphomicrobiaceae bacterium]